VVLVAVGLAAVSLWLGATRLGVNSDSVAMLDEDLPFRQTWQRYGEAFPHLDDNLLAVIEAPTPEQAQAAASDVVARLAARDDIARSVVWSAGSDFFADNGLLYLPPDALEELADRLAEAQPLLGRLAGDTRAAAVFELLEQLEANAANPAAATFDRAAIHARVAEALDAALDDRPRWLSWQRLLDDAPGGVARETLVIDPVLDHSRVLAGRPVIENLRELRAGLGLDRGPVRLYLTGSVALGFEEMQSVIDGARLTGVLALVLVSIIMYAGLRSVRLGLIALLNLALGLSITVGFAAVAIGRVNMISVAFVVLYIGLGINYAVHYLLRYREIASAEPNRVSAVIAAGRFLSRPLLLSAATTALGFFAFVPTAFTGIAQLGLIAGVAMLVTLLLSYTTLPAMLAWLQPDLAHDPPETGRGWRRALEIPLKQRAAVIAAGAVLAGAALPLALQLRFDADPLNLRDAESESVQTIRALFDAGEGGYRNIQVLLAPTANPAPLVAELRALATVERVVSLADMVPRDQDEKLVILDDLGWLLGPAIINADWRVDPPDSARLARAAGALAQALEADESRALPAALERLERRLATAESPDSVAAQVDRHLVGGLEYSLGRLARGLRADAPVTRDDLPDWLVAQFRGRDGTRLIQVFPAVDVGDFERQRAFAEQVLDVAGHAATGGPVIQLAAGEAITKAFRQALLWAVIGIGLVLLLALRSVGASLKVLAPLALGGLATAAVMVAVDIPFNFANVVALPLLLGVAVDNGIHLVLRHRAGLLPAGNVLESATARAIVFGALITAGGFGNLAFSPHAGTATLGLVLTIGLGLMVMATLVFLPALLGRRAA